MVVAALRFLLPLVIFLTSCGSAAPDPAPSDYESGNIWTYIVSAIYITIVCVIVWWFVKRSGGSDEI